TRAPLAPESRCAPLRRAPVERVLESGAGLKIDLPLAVDAGALNAAFPTVIEWFGERRVAGLALLSTAVGMEWPGALSLLADVKLSLAHGEQSARNVLALSVELNKPEHRYTTVRIGAPDFEGEIGAFFRPPPVTPLTYDELRGRVAPIAFSGWTVVVVGGSRGLGAITAKLMAAGGAQVIFTYREAESEAADVRDDIVANGGQCAMLQYDASGCGVLALPMNAAPSGKVLLFYAASPRIFRRRTDTFVRAWLDEFLAVYVDGFLNAANAVTDWTTGPVSILYPSSQALDEPIGDLVEYAAAKAVGEIVCRALAVGKRLRIEVPRLPRLLTDQTNAVVQARTEPAADILLPLLLRLTSGR
ncbi:MAG: SDR family NAD(P)-dependent oxidoreductase, partial [Legionella sp.]|nr:SDR family NAD(P)-dependent oxidoreductase [Legionella sp.]